MARATTALKARAVVRKYFTAGAGLRLNVFGLDFSYLIPVNGKNSPLANTFRFSLTFDFNGNTNAN